MSAADRHARVSALFLAALDQPTDVRLAWVDTQDADSDLRSEVRSMLIKHADPTPAFFDEPLVQRTTTNGQDEQTEDRLIGETIGGWTLTGPLGRGGMGSVYRAERADETFEQHAALKIVRPGFERDFGARFLRERALLANLDHRGIARLLDGGLTEDGTPYLAMELVEGQPLTAYADTYGLEVDERLRLFLQVCDAVAYAHRNLVVHRDLKPSHMLVAVDPNDELTVKLLDFGIAKLLDTDEERLTRTGAGPMTPSYAAPEQVLGRPLTTATDVYALGIVLYELLAGQRPYDLTTLTASQIERVVSQDRPSRPSEVADSTTARRLAGDLDTIVLKALAKEPNRRYESADALADDLRRHQDGLPVRARPDTVRYRLGKFIGRHRVGVAATGAMVVLIVALSTFYALRLTAERDRARSEAERSAAVAGFLEQILRAPNTNWYVEGEATGPETPIRAVLDEAAARIERNFADQPDLRADLHHILGDTYRALGLWDETTRHRRNVLTLRESLYTPPHPKIAEALYYIATIPGGDEIDQIRMLERAVAMQRARDEGNNFPFMLTELASRYLKMGYAARADSLEREAIAYVERVFVAGHDGFRYRDPMQLPISTRLVRANAALGYV